MQFRQHALGVFTASLTVACALIGCARDGAPGSDETDDHGGPAGGDATAGSGPIAEGGRGAAPSATAGGGGQAAPIDDGPAPAMGGRPGASPFEAVNGFEPHFVPPPQSGMADIRRDFGAVGDGVADDTAAFKRALEADDPRTIYVPAGTYLIKDSLRYGEVSKKKKRVLLIGERRSQSIVRLADEAPGFADPDKPKVFIHTRSSAQQAEQNMHMYIYHLTIEVGRGNPGAIALNFHTNNTGAVKDVSIRATDPVAQPGLVGIAFDDFWFGPGNARYLEVDGFRTGIRVGSAQNHTTLEHVTVRNCEIGLQNDGNGISVRALHTASCKLPVKADGGLSVIVDSSLRGGRGGPAIQVGKGHALIARTTTDGYDVAIAAGAGKHEDGNVMHWSSAAATGNWSPPSGKDGPLALPVGESPERQYPRDAGQWAVVGGDGDISGAVQAAIDAGKSTVYVTGGRIDKTVELRGKLERIMGLGVRTIDYHTGDAPVFRLGPGTASAVIIELLYENYGSQSGITVEHAAPRTLVFRHGSGSYRTAPSGRGGKVFIESVVGYPFTFDGVAAWLRDINTEMGGNARPNIVNAGSSVWILGHKTEDYATKIATRAGGFTELLGGSYRQNWDAADGVMSLVEGNPLFLIEDAHASLSFLTWPTHAGAPAYKHLVRERRGGELRSLVNRGHGGDADGNQPLFVGYTARPR